ncbi:MAG: hypothetical protein R2795_22200 [Saprospiraceae bacterium]
MEFHIFLCTLGPVMILFHTAFKFGGIVSISFWSMVIVVASGVIGRFIYVQIPRTIEGRELSLAELQEMKIEVSQKLAQTPALDASAYQQLLNATRDQSARQGNLLVQMFRKQQLDSKAIRQLKQQLKQAAIPRSHVRETVKIFRKDFH